MKEWFKHEFGYVNVDAENLYLTNSGNWSDTKKLNEKTKNNKTKKRSSIIGFLILVFCLFLFMIYKSTAIDTIGVTLFIMALGYKLYLYLKFEIGPQFKIPIAKISEVKIDDKSVEIYFLDGDGVYSSFVLEKVEEKGKNILNSLNQFE